MTRPTRLSVCRRSESGPRRGTYCFGRSCPKSRRTSGRSRTPSPPASTTAQIGEAGETRSSALGVSRAQAVVGFMGAPGAGTGRPEWGYAAAGTLRGFDFWGPAAIRDSPRRVPGRYLTPETPLGRGPPVSLDDGVGAYQDRLRNHHAQRSSALHVDHQLAAQREDRRPWRRAGKASGIVCERRGPSARRRARPRRENIADRPLRRRPGTAPEVDRFGAEPAGP